MLYDLVLGLMFAVCVTAFVVALGGICGYGIHTAQVVAVMLETRYGWRDSRAILRKRARSKYGLPPSHRKQRVFAPAYMMRRELPAGDGDTLVMIPDDPTWRVRAEIERNHEW